MKKEKLKLILSATPLEFRFSLRKNFVIVMIVINSDNRIIDPELHLTQLIINKKESFPWMEAVGNGLRDSNWFSLPPSETTSMSWSTMGEQLFSAPGEYILQLRLRNIKSEQIKVIVLKD
jgi:hypothetical protein